MGMHSGDRATRVGPAQGSSPSTEAHPGAGGLLFFERSFLILYLGSHLGTQDAFLPISRHQRPLAPKLTMPHLSGGTRVTLLLSVSQKRKGPYRRPGLNPRWMWSQS